MKQGKLPSSGLRARPFWTEKSQIVTVRRLVIAAALFSIASCGKSGPNPSSTAVTSNDSIAAANVQVIKVADFAADPFSEHVTAAAALPEGGFLALTSSRGGSFAYKISNLGTVIWRKDLPAGITAAAAGISDDGSYWIVGNLTEYMDVNGRSTLSSMADFAERIETNGAMSPLTSLSPKNKSRFSRCVARLDDGYVQSEHTSQLDEYLHLEVHRISMVDAHGTTVWEHVLGFDHGRRIIRDSSTFANSDDQIAGCAGVFVAENDRIIAAARVFVFPDLRTDDEVFQEMTRYQARHLQSATVLIALDSKGNEIGSVRHDDTSAALLVRSPGGAMLFETAQKKSGAGVFNTMNTVGQRLSLYEFDSNLKELKPPITFDDTNFDSVDAAYRTRDGGLLIKACDGQVSQQYLRYISPVGAISPKLKLETVLRRGGVVSFSAGAQPNEVLMLVQTALQNSQILTVKYSN
ncbi:MAG TPA: hypothetical protein VHW95_06120 [Steroidobacteraceae bacterium]|jgi:hypothetical protein|nr:hypothetical protein [Steroidobacteraceae bacterium]